MKKHEQLQNLFSQQCYDTTAEGLPDIQSQHEDFFYAIPAVGVSQLKLPIIIEENGTIQHSVAIFELTVAIGQHDRGTHMSRFVEVIESAIEKPLTLEQLETILHTMQEKLKTEVATIQLTFPWHFYTTSPATNTKSFQYATITIKSNVNEQQQVTHDVSLHCLATTLCPCSKEISRYGAHNQRSNITISGIITDRNVPSDWKSILKDLAIQNASAPIYSLLKRPDEKFVTEQAYENPRFVEDLARLIAAELSTIHWLQQRTVICENEESIHTHNAIAKIILRDQKERQS